MPDPILSTEPLGFPWPCFDPFLFCAYHLDKYPKGDGKLAPAASLQGRSLGQDFEGIDGWNMYHGQTVPGFPQHPHRGFEVITVTKQGLIDHSDSLGATARYGQGDVQWLCAGEGISHTEMFPLVNTDKANPLELFQIWLNLPPGRKMVKPSYNMLWADRIPVLDPAKGVQVRAIAGVLEGKTPPPPPSDSWAAEPANQVAIWDLGLEAGAAWSLPAVGGGVERTLYLYDGAGLEVGGVALGPRLAVRLKGSGAVALKAAEKARALLLQGRPIGAPVASYGPFVMNTQAELRQAFEDYQRTRFGGWPWGEDGPVHGVRGRFARFADGREEAPA